MDYKCNLIIDSCCDLPYEVVDREGVYLLEFPYFDSAGEHLDDLYRSRSSKDFFDGMRNGEEPTTAQLSPLVLRSAFEWAHEQGLPTVYLSFSSGLSGTFDAACLLLEQMREELPGLDVRIVDTKLASIAEAFLVYEAMRQREKGFDADELVAWAEEARYYVDAQFMVSDLECLRRGGRIPSSVAFAGAKLDVKPLLGFDLDGKLSLSGVARGRKKGIKSLFEYFQKRAASHAPGQNVVLGNADCPKDAERLADYLTKHDDSLLFLESDIGPVIGSHVGPDMLAIVFWGNDRRNEVSVSDRIANKIKGR